MAKTKELRDQLKIKISAAAASAVQPAAPVTTATTATTATETTSQEVVTPEVYYAYAKPSAAAPYLIFDVEEITREDGRTTCELEVNCLDYARNTERCENIADAVEKALDHTVTITENIEFHVYANRRNNVSSNDVQIVRRRLTFDLYLYERT